MARYMRTLTVRLDLEVGTFYATVEVRVDGSDLDLRTLHKLANDVGGTWDADGLCKAEQETRGWDYGSDDLVDEILDAVRYELLSRELAFDANGDVA